MQKVKGLLLQSRKIKLNNKAAIEATGGIIMVNNELVEVSLAHSVKNPDGK